jgi:hypothetical protein
MLRKGTEGKIQSQARQLLEYIRNAERQQASFHEQNERQKTTAQTGKEEATGWIDTETVLLPPGISRDTASSTAIREGKLVLAPPKGAKANGILIAIECSGEGVVFVLRTSGKTLRFHAPDPEKIPVYNSSGDDVGTMTMACGPFLPPTPLAVTYQDAKSEKVKSNGEVLALFFGKKEQ